MKKITKLKEAQQRLTGTQGEDPWKRRQLEERFEGHDDEDQPRIVAAVGRAEIEGGVRVAAPKIDVGCDGKDQKVVERQIQNSLGVGAMVWPKTVPAT